MNREAVELAVFDLLETKDFQELSAKEEAMVLSIMDKSTYQMQRRIMLEAGESESIIPGPLVIPAKRKVLPIWIASVSSAAAAAILVFLMIEPAQLGDVKVQAVSPLVVRDTLIVENTVTDTIVDYRVVKVKDDRPERQEVTMVQIPETVSGAEMVPIMRENDIVNAGVSAANDAEIEVFRTQPFIGM